MSITNINHNHYKSFVTDLMLKAITCEFITLRDSLIKDRIVLGIISQLVR